jgi:hypothetical protein
MTGRHFWLVEASRATQSRSISLDLGGSHVSDPIQLTVHDYRGFIQKFRAAMGVGASVRTGSAPPPATVEVATVGAVYRYQRSNLYLTHGRAAGFSAFQALAEHYAHMDTDIELNVGAITNALNAAPGNARTRPIIIAITSEAARSQVVYQVIQRVLHSNLEVAWSELQPLFGVWGYFTVDQTQRSGRREGYHHKSKPPAFGPLGVRDYYNDADAAKAMDELRTAGFTIE